MDGWMDVRTAGLDWIGLERQTDAVIHTLC